MAAPPADQATAHYRATGMTQIGRHRMPLTPDVIAVRLALVIVPGVVATIAALVLT